MKTRWNEQSYRAPGRKWQGFFASVMLACLLGAASLASSANDVVNGVYGGVQGPVPPPSQAADVPAAVLPPPPGAIVINFDGVAKPCCFIQTTALRNDFSALGVTFAGPGINDGFAILDQSGGFGVSGFSPPNFLAWNESAGFANGGFSKGPETLNFSSPVSLVQVNAGSGSSGGQIKMEAFNSSNVSLGSASLTLSAALQTLQVTANGITKVVITVPVGSAGVLDDLAFVTGGPPPSSLVCDLQPLSKTTFVNNDTVIAKVLVRNDGTVEAPVEVKIWLDIAPPPPPAPPIPPFSIINVGADGSVKLPAGFTMPTPATVFQFTVGSTFPRGPWQFGCRFIHPVTGKFITERLLPFTIQ